MIRIVFTLIAIYRLKWRQVDLTVAYLNASRKDAETVYMSLLVASMQTWKGTKASGYAC